MKSYRNFDDRLKKELKNPEFKKAFDQEEIFASLAIQIAKIRQKQGLSQKDLDKRLKTTQQTVSRIEDIMKTAKKNLVKNWQKIGVALKKLNKKAVKEKKFYMIDELAHLLNLMKNKEPALRKLPTLHVNDPKAVLIKATRSNNKIKKKPTGASQKPKSKE